MTAPTRTTPYRCPHWSPGVELKCELDRGHDGPCRAQRPRWSDANPGYVVVWRPFAAEREAA